MPQSLPYILAGLFEYVGGHYSVKLFHKQAVDGGVGQLHSS